jgi:predicted phosphohydrolase
MTVWALSDPHLAFGVPSKTMEAFGPLWKDYPARIEGAWRERVSSEDLVLIPGDISWAMDLKEALVDLEWIHRLPGTKVILKGNHDYWWPSSSKLVQALPPSILFVHNNALLWNEVAIGGTRLWDSSEYRFDEIIHFQKNPLEKKSAPPAPEDTERIFERELERLRLSLSQLNPQAKTRIALTHYPPIGCDLKPSRAAAILEEFKIEVCIFGHLHSVRRGVPLFGEARGVRYLFTSCDYLDFIPLRVF